MTYKEVFRFNNASTSRGCEIHDSDQKGVELAEDLENRGTLYWFGCDIDDPCPDGQNRGFGSEWALRGL
jgi:hypothetical protein